MRGSFKRSVMDNLNKFKTPKLSSLLRPSQNG
jgi:hypothetical protein